MTEKPNILVIWGDDIGVVARLAADSGSCGR